MSTELTPDLRVLVYSALLCLVLWIPYILAAINTRGTARVAGYPTGDYQDLPDWAQRAYRAHVGMVENLAPFAALVLVAHVTATANEATAMAAWIFFGARIVQAAVHIAGIPWVRTIAFTVGWAANLVILWHILL